MSFRNAVVSGLTLVREAIQSLGYVAGSVGWAVNRDGSAEFSDATIRGTVDAATINGSVINSADINGGTVDAAVITGSAIAGGTIAGTDVVAEKVTVNGADGSQIRIFEDTQDLFGSAAIDLLPKPIGSPLTLYRAKVYVTSLLNGAVEEARLFLRGPRWDIYSYAYMTFYGRDSDASAIDMYADTITLRGNDGGAGGTGSGKVELRPSGRDTISSSVVRNGNRTFLHNVELSTQLNPSGSKGSSGYVNVPTISAIAITKQFSDTRLMLTLMMTAWSTIAGTEIEFAYSVGGGPDIPFTSHLFNNAGEHLSIVGMVEVPGLSAGAKSIALRWQRLSGTGAITVDGADVIFWRAEEVAP